MSDNRIPDDIFKQAVAKACEIEISVFEKKFKDAGKHTFSEKYLEGMQKLKVQKDEDTKSSIVKYQIKEKSLKLKILLIAAIVMLVGSMTVLAVEPLQEIFYHLIETIFPDNTEIRFEKLERELQKENKNITNDSFEVMLLENVPEGYYLEVQEIDKDHCCTLEIYINDQGQTLTCIQQTLGMFDTVAISSDGNPAKRISVNGRTAYWFEDEKHYHTIIYPKDGYAFQISGYDNLEVLIECAKSFSSERYIDGQETYLKPKEIPDGYYLESENIINDSDMYSFSQTYLNSKDEVIHYVKGNKFRFDGASITSDGTPAEEIAVCGEIAYLITDDSQWHTILYPKGEFIYEISSYEDVDVLVEILESIFDESLEELDMEVVEKEEESEVPADEWFEFCIHVDGGRIFMDYSQMEDCWETSVSTSMQEGQRVAEIIFDTDVDGHIEEIQKEGYKFVGWTVYEGDFFTYVNEEEEVEIKEGEEVFPISEFMDCIMGNVELYAEKISTEELREIKCTGKSFYVTANWEMID